MAMRRIQQTPGAKGQARGAQSTSLQDHIAVIEEAQKNPGKPFVLNMANDAHYRVVKYNYDSIGLTPGRYPQLFNQLELARTGSKPGELLALDYDTDEDGFTDANVINNLGVDVNGNAVTQALSTYIGGAYSVVLTIQLFNKANYDLLASSNTHVIGEGEFTPLQAISNEKAPKEMLAAFYIDYTKTVNSPTQHLVVTRDITVGPIADPTITQPVQKPAHINNPYIIIGLSRGIGNRNNVDYWFNQGQWANKTVMVPLVGSVTFNSNIKPLQPNDTIQLNLSVAMKTGGLNVTPVDPLNDVYPYFTISPSDPKTLLFNKAAPTDPNSTDNGNPIVFGEAPWNADTVVYFFCNIAVKTDNSFPFFTQANIQSSDMPDIDPLDGTLYIKPFQFTWHCLAEGTKITLANGKRRRIETLKGGEKILVNKKETLEVNATFVGKHKGDVIVIRTENGSRLVLSDTHVVAVPGGFRLAFQLEKGDTVITEQGKSKLIAVKRKPFEGFLFNLSLGTFEQMRKRPKESNTMFANGILVGDQTLQSYYYDTYLKSDEVVLQKLPKQWHRDFNSLVEDIARDARQ